MAQRRYLQYVAVAQNHRTPAEGRKGDWKDVEPIIKIHPELLFCNQNGQVLIGCRNNAQFNFTEGAIAAIAMGVNRACDELLAGTSFSLDENRGVGCGNGSNLI